jgi:hypothetical protein
MDFIRQEVNLFVYASEHLLGDGVLPEELTTDERDIIQYYLVSMAGKFPVACQLTSSQKTGPTKTGLVC